MSSLFNIYKYINGSDGKESACNVGDLGSISESGRPPGEEDGPPTPVFLPRESQGQRSYSPRGHKHQTQLSDQHFIKKF